MKNILQNKTTNNLTVAVILGYATLNFVSTVVGPVISNIFDSSAGSSWVWSDFWGALVLYVVFWLVAGLVNSQSD